MTTDKLEIVSMIHAYPPQHNAGAETYVHQLHRWLVERGHRVTVLQRDPVYGSTWDGIKTTRRGPPRWTDRITRTATILTHLDETPIAEAAASRADRPLVHILHNDKQLDFHGVHRADLIIANTHWLAETIPDRFEKVPRAVLYPPTFTTDYRTSSTERDAITLVNMLDGKGAPLFYELARRLPDRRFLAVTGAYGAQIPVPDLPNLDARPNRPNMAPVWDQTRIYLQPSIYESYGKAAVEALASAIPVIAHPTDGLTESLGDAGIFCDRDRIEEWVAAIEDLDDSKSYRRQSRLARSRAEQLESETLDQLEEVERLLAKIAR